MNDRRRKPDDRVRLLHGPYRAPRLRVGDRASCLYRDCDVVITGWTDAPIPRPASALAPHQKTPMVGRDFLSLRTPARLTRLLSQ